MSLKPDDIELMLFFFQYFFVFNMTNHRDQVQHQLQAKDTEPNVERGFRPGCQQCRAGSTNFKNLTKMWFNMIINVFCALPCRKKKIWVIFQNCLFEGQPQSGCMGFQRWGISEWQVWENKSGGSPDTLTMMDFFQGISIFYQVKDGRGLRKFIKETLHATAGKKTTSWFIHVSVIFFRRYLHFLDLIWLDNCPGKISHELLGSVEIPLKNIPASGVGICLFWYMYICK